MNDNPNRHHKASGRKRPCQIVCYATEQEKALILENMRQSSITNLSDYLRLSALASLIR